MSGFPLYDNLCKNASNKDLTVKQKKNFVSKIDKLNKNSKELMYALIKTHYLMTTSYDKSFPYEGKNNSNVLEFNLEKFPKNLKQILNKFLTMNLELKQ